MLGRGPAGVAMAGALALVVLATALSAVVPYASPATAFLAVKLALAALVAACGAALVAAALAALGRGSLGESSPVGLALVAASLVLGLLAAALEQGVLPFLAALAVAIALGAVWWRARSRRA